MIDLVELVMPNYVYVGPWILTDEDDGPICGLLLVNIPYFGPPRDPVPVRSKYTETISLVSYTSDKPVRIIFDYGEVNDNATTKTD